ncbi:Re/Si-specific NAD(P)(+) transhydrogenase subunit alpha [Marinobacter sp. X15-166B]|uniref:Re/Si-specific NAD(P)(+) transhydrogenase subunit alpha n=1 Tax=Marinobacter sp. X15-166B TaxID=1897620 RepID=UPI00085CBA8F|nr:Re/Si-specific NAD(P)(+) transhydrogenase subunit alpha [Marinobacter sp. X15-166B]OEY67936.1 NAD(P) transhydrogenase subunit alpha [Marinobacter sp. X15-166B]
MKLGIPREVHDNEHRVAATPASVRKLIALGHEVAVERGAGMAAQFADGAYEQAGATLVDTPQSLYARSECLLKVRAPGHHPQYGVDEADWLPEGGHLLAYLWPAQHPELLQTLAGRGVTAFAIDSLPRISRAQPMDALSSMANIAGYRAVIEAAQHFGRFFTGQVTAAGKVPPATVLVIGAGVAGLAAIGTARSLGAVVRAFDTRPEVREQVASLGADFLAVNMAEESSGGGGYGKAMSDEFIRQERALFLAQARQVDIIITTAQIPGKPAPTLITTEMVEAMQPGSVIVDLAAERGGNCELTQPGAVVVHHGVTVVGYTDLPSRMATVASELYATNLLNLVAALTPEKDGQFQINLDDEVIRGVTVTHRGRITWPPPDRPPPDRPTPPPAPPTPGPEEPLPGAQQQPAAPARKHLGRALLVLLAAAALIGVGAYAPPSFLAHFTVFVLACFIGWQVVWKVTPALHTPLMSVTNAISGIIVIGAMLHLARSDSALITVMSFVAVLIASINLAGGFRVTQRMLNMFRK